MYSIYLAGGISNISFEEANAWREYVMSKLPGITCYSPLRHKKYLEGKGTLPQHNITGSNKPLSTDKGIIARDYFDVHRVDLLFVNLLETTKVSIGTVAEIAWAYQLRKPIVLAMENDNIHMHTFIKEMVPFIVSDLDKAIDLTLEILAPEFQEISIKTIP